MSAFEHNRFEIYSNVQHPYKHAISEFFYTHDALPSGYSSLEDAMNWVFAVLYPKSKPAVADVASLPLVGNTLNDMRVVQDDGDGKAASYRWEQREGEVSASWHKIYDLDWGTDSILQAWGLKTQDVYVMRQGYDDRDASGAVIVGDLAGQTIYGGATANTNLTLFSNSGDGVGAATGYVQFGDNLRPLTNDTLNIGMTGYRVNDVMTKTAHIGTMVISGGSITDTSGAISFDNENLSTSGTVTSGTLKIEGGKISDTSGAISFDNEDLSTTGKITANYIVATTSASSFFTGTTIGNLTLGNGAISDSSGAISFSACDLTTTGDISGLTVTGTDYGVFGSIKIDGNEVFPNIADTSLILKSTGTGKVDIQSSLEADSANFVGTVDITGQLNPDNLRLDGNTISTTNADGDLTITPNGTGKIIAGKALKPSTDLFALGTTTERWGIVYVGTSISNGTDAITMSDLLTLRNMPYRDAARTQPAQAGDALFWDAVSGTWLANHPDSEIAHSELSGLTTTDAGHTQFVMLAGRSGGQTVQGGTAATESLILESTAHASKGSVNTKDNFFANSDASYSGGWSGIDIGGASNRFRHVYTAGEFIGLRLENVGVFPSSSSQKVGRLYYYTTTGRVYVDTGSAVEMVGDSYRYADDTVWNGTDLTKTVTVTTTGMDVRSAIIQLKDNTNNFEVVNCKIESLNATDVRITTTDPLPAGSYRLICIQ